MAEGLKQVSAFELARPGKSAVQARILPFPNFPRGVPLRRCKLPKKSPAHRAPGQFLRHGVRQLTTLCGAEKVRGNVVNGPHFSDPPDQSLNLARCAIVKAIKSYTTGFLQTLPRQAQGRALEAAQFGDSRAKGVASLQGGSRNCATGEKLVVLADGRVG